MFKKVIHILLLVGILTALSLNVYLLYRIKMTVKHGLHDIIDNQDYLIQINK